MRASSVTPQTAPEQDFSVAAMISAVADGYPADAGQRAVIGYALITDALGRGATWAQIGAAQGISGREAKRRAHKLRLAVQRAAFRGACDDRAG